MRDYFCFLGVDSFQQGLYYMFVEDKMLGKINFTRKNIVLGKFKDRKINVGWFGDGDDMGVKIEWFFFQNYWEVKIWSFIIYVLRERGMKRKLDGVIRIKR